MKVHLLKLLVIGVVTIAAASSCSSTFQGVVRDTKRNTHKVGQSMGCFGEKIRNSTR